MSRPGCCACLSLPRSSRSCSEARDPLKVGKGAAKLWLAGDVRNWDMADYQIDELKEGLEDVVKHFPVYKEMPVGQMIGTTIMTPIAEVEKAIKARDRGKFVSTFDKLTDTCNTCHQSANRAFIVVRAPRRRPSPISRSHPSAIDAADINLCRDRPRPRGRLHP